MAKRTDGRPRHQQIAADLRARIMSGELGPGTQLPSTPKLVAQYAAANATIQRALASLKDEGFLDSHIGKGVYVRARQPHVVDIAAYLAPSPRGYSYQLLDVREARPPADVAEALALADDDLAVLRHRLLLHADEPVELSWSYYPLQIVRGSDITKRGKIPGGAPRVLADLGYPQRELLDRLSARLPTTHELELLDLPDDVPVIRQLRVIHSDGAQPVEASILVKGAHLYELKYLQPIPH
ncbi:GntR family transcriptional regulator [Phytohabitans sp. ZYX-F-186]|uniref:GntR family transcriptional regulator n=1 Tax=Phytohabitans maris TaxID=3071409 RepID=A0ABU0ZE46_9ACTN|nr:GntR family transcriptional regulator [Phytohabitans sp. ZYX-F-186]MDQ7904701.1 GntR family transcriptional regulator [Phytohabitans sp. ZYX-F-186]